MWPLLSYIYDLDCLMHGLDCLIYGLDCLIYGLPLPGGSQEEVQDHRHLPDREPRRLRECESERVRVGAWESERVRE